jgi:hypothetical protein
LSETEAILKQDSGVKSHESESPPTMGLKAGAFADVGTLILTNARLLYIAKGGASRAAAWALGGVFAAQAVEKRVSKAEIDELMQDKASHSTPLQDITRVEAGKKMGSSYIRVDRVGSDKPVHAYVFASGGTNQEWAAAINQAKANVGSTQSNPKVTFSAPQTPSDVSTQRICQKCGASDSGKAKFCTSCGTPFAQTQTEMPLPPPPPPSSTAPMCPYCRKPIRYIEQYKRWYCDAERKYV